MRVSYAALILWCLVANAQAAEPEAKSKPAETAEDFSEQLKPTPLLDLASAGKAIHVLNGFHAELVAAEPLVASPVAMSFDADGRLYVVEMRDYPESPDARLGRVKLLTDTDGDGRFDKDTIFVADLSWPTSVLCYDGGVFIAAAPDILYCKDTNADGQADVREVVFSGFGRGNVQGLVNSLTWGLDNRIHGATSSNGAQLRPGGDPQARPLVLSGRDFSFDPRTREVRAESGGGQHGLTFDDWGNKFVCSNSDHIQAVMCEDRYLARNPRAEVSAARVSIAADGPQAEVFRTSPVETWRVLRTRLRVSGVVPGLIEGGGRAAGYFTGATGITIYRGDAWPDEQRGLAFVGDVGSNLVHRKRIESRGIEYVARRIDEGCEFLSSSDIWFRPVGMANAPDGALYVMDMCRETIEHPASLPPQIKKHLDLNSGRERGRIYRVAPTSFQQSIPPKLSKSTTSELVRTLASRNGWHRDAAARLLYERQDRAAIADLAKMASGDKLPLARLHALYALDGLHGLDEQALLLALSDIEPRVRQHAVRLAEPWAEKSQSLRAAMLSMTADDDPRVRYQLAFALGGLTGDDRNQAMARLLKRDPADPWLRTSIWSGLASGGTEVLAALLDDRTLLRTADGLNVLAALARQLALQDSEHGAANVLALIVKQQTAGAPSAAAAAVIRGLMQAQARATRFTVPAELADQFAEILNAARIAVADSQLAAEERAEAVGLLPLFPADESRVLLAGLLEPTQPQVVQFAALKALRLQSDRQAAAAVVEAWPKLSPQARGEGMETLFARADWLPVLLSAVETGIIAPAEIDPARAKAIATHKDPAIRAQVARLFDPGKQAKRSEVVDAYRDALQLSGDASRGKPLFLKHCSACHKVAGEGHEIGPNLAAMRNRGPEAILIALLDPNREVNPQFVSYLVETGSGRLVTGLVASESATSITLRRGEGASDTVLRADVESLRSSGLSLMPEGFEKQMDTQAVADLIAYLLTLK